MKSLSRSTCASIALGKMALSIGCPRYVDLSDSSAPIRLECILLSAGVDILDLGVDGKSIM